MGCRWVQNASQNENKPPGGPFCPEIWSKIAHKRVKKKIFPVNFRFSSKKITNNDPKLGQMGWNRTRILFGLPGGAKGFPERNFALYDAILSRKWVKNSPETGQKLTGKWPFWTDFWAIFDPISGFLG